MVTWFPFLLSMTFLSIWRRVAHTGRGEDRKGGRVGKGRRERENSYCAQSTETCHNTSGGGTPMALHRDEGKIFKTKHGSGDRWKAPR